MTKFQKLIINGKFLAAKPTGVHRVARQLLLELQKQQVQIEQLFSSGMYVAVPRNGKITCDIDQLRIETHSNFIGQVWEQFELPVNARGNLLLSLCNLSPIFSRNAITMIHDAQVYTTPRSYSLAFRTWYKFVLPQIGRRGLKILTVSQYSANQLVEYGVTTPDRVAIIYNGVDHVLGFGRDSSVNEALGLERNGYVLALSSTQKHKNIEVLLQAFAQEPGSRLVLIGAAKRQDFTDKGIDVPSHVSFAGKVSDDQMRSLMEDALCFAMPSLTEGFGLPPLEAMMLGCPAIVAPCGALPEVCSDAALYADPYDPAAWANGVASLRRDPALRQKLIEAGRAQSGRFTWEAAGQMLMDTLRSVVSSRAL